MSATGKTKPVAAGTQTLDRGLRLLELLAANPRGLPLSAIAEHLGVHRTIAYRMVETLEAHELVRKGPDRLISLAYGMVRLAEAVDRDLRAVARPVLAELAEATSATAHLMVVASDDEVEAAAVVEPSHLRSYIAFRPGHRHPLRRGSGGLAILAARPAKDDDPPGVREARQRGWSTSTGEVVPSVTGVSTALRTPDYLPEASIGVSFVGEQDVEKLARAVMDAGERLSALLYGNR
ncbi:MAG TPA: helix-turn-helix domain-containing protein [Actinomycetales bacterium]|jgi:DNA-binding IclR family transcriptional regulator|nr:helix-turn-helix domain-containing protein [Actinomycetales bacterium]